MSKIKVGEVWRTYVLCCGDTWFTMNIDLFGEPNIAERYQKNPGCHVEIWTFYRDARGDIKTDEQIAACGVTFIDGRTYAVRHY